MTTNELLKQAYEMIHSLKKQVQELPAREDIAVVGMACRFPGGCDTPEEYWRFLRDGRDAAIEVPKDRWDIDEYYDPVRGTPGKMYIRKANFLQRDIGEFDARFFRISPTEASAMDPQQRQLLEVAWEALENAGQNPAELAGSKTGVYIGINSTCEYAMLPQDDKNMNQYHGTGTTSSIASGRISYVFGFNGPTLSVDTACSSSLVTALLAVDALRNKNCDMALAGGVNMLVSPYSMSALCLMNALSESGRSAPFDESADGYGRGEGCGILVLKRLSDAQRDGDRIYALICGGAINNDGASSGLTVPNGDAQRMVIQDALKNCGFKPDQISYLETHGTGTALGDPIEVKAITEVFGGKKRKKPLILGAVKGNIGHLESAAGVAGLIKVILSLYHREIVPVCNFEVQNPRIDFSRIPAVLPQGSRSWDKAGQAERVAGISSFGFSGTNAHVILKEAPEDMPEAAGEDKEPCVLCLSAKERDALRRMLERYAQYLETNENVPLRDICYTADTTRAQFPFRFAFTGASHGEMAGKIRQKIAEMEKDPNLPAQLTTNPKFAFLLSGRVPDEDSWEALSRYPGCAKYFDGVMEQIKACFGEETAEAVRSGEQKKSGPNIDKLRGFVLEFVMTGWMGDMGILPEIAAGSGAGALTAAVCAGILSMEDAVRLLARECGLASGEEPETGHPRCRYVSLRAGHALQTVSPAELAMDVQGGQPGPEDIRDYLYQEGYRYFVEIGGMKEPPEDQRPDVTVLRLLSGPCGEEIAKALAVCFADGAPVRFRGFYRMDEVRKAVLPNYPFAKTRYWLKTAEETQDGLAPAFSRRGLDGHWLNLPGKQKRIEYGFSLENFRELKDNSGVVHVGYYLEMLLGAMGQFYPDTPFKISRMDFSSPILVMEGEKKQALLTLEEQDDGLLAFSFYSKNQEEKNWQRNVSGQIIPSPEPEPDEGRPALPEGVGRREDTGDEFYSLLEGLGLSFGKAVRWVNHITGGKDAALAEFREASEEEGSYQLGFHPGVVDGCAQVCNYLAAFGQEEQKRYMISSLSDIAVARAEDAHGLRAWVTLDADRRKEDELFCGIRLENKAGQKLLSIREVRAKRFDEALLLRMSQAQNTAQGGVNRAFIAGYTAADEQGKRDMLTDFVRELMADVLGMKPEEIDPDGKVDELGLDSMAGMLFYSHLTQSLGIDISFVDLMESGTCRGTADVLMPCLPGGVRFKQAKPEEERAPYDADLSLAHWIYDYKEKPAAKMRLFCFPYGFGSASMYKEWQQILGDEVDVCSIKIPGLDMERMREMPAEDIDELMETIYKVVSGKLLDKPCATFGNSWGSLFSYRLAYRLSRDPAVKLGVCFISGYTSPSLPNTSLMEILGELKKIGYDHIPTDQELRETHSLEEISRAFISAWGQSVRSDEDTAVAGTKISLRLIASAYRLIEHYHYDPRERFSVPIVGYHGIDDYRVPLEDMNAWETITTGGYKMYTVPGDHAFIDKDQSEARVLELMGQEIRERFHG